MGKQKSRGSKKKSHAEDADHDVAKMDWRARADFLSMMVEECGTECHFSLFSKTERASSQFQLSELAAELQRRGVSSVHAKTFVAVWDLPAVAAAEAQREKSINIAMLNRDYEVEVEDVSGVNACPLPDAGIDAIFRNFAPPVEKCLTVRDLPSDLRSSIRLAVAVLDLWAGHYQTTSCCLQRIHQDIIDAEEGSDWHRFAIDEAICDAFIEAGLIESTLLAMRRAPLNLQVQESGLELLSQLVGHDDPPTDVAKIMGEASKRALSAGVIDRTVDAMVLAPRIPTVWKYYDMDAFLSDGASIIHTMVGYNCNRGYLIDRSIDNGIMDALVGALKYKIDELDLPVGCEDLSAFKDKILEPIKTKNETIYGVANDVLLALDTIFTAPSPNVENVKFGRLEWAMHVIELDERVPTFAAAYAAAYADAHSEIRAFDVSQEDSPCPGEALAEHFHRAYEALEKRQLAIKLASELMFDETPPSKTSGASSSAGASGGSKKKSKAKGHASTSSCTPALATAASAPADDDHVKQASAEGGGDADADVTDGAAVEAARATADAALHAALEDGGLDAITHALETYRGAATEDVVSRARTARDKLKEKRKKESHKQRRAHAAMMMAAQQALPVTELSKPQGGDGGCDEAEAPRAVWAPPTRFAPTHATCTTGEAVHNWELSVLAAATGGFSESSCIGRGGCAAVYRAELPLTPPVSPPVLVAVKRASYPEADHRELDRELAVLARCQHPHLLPLIGYCRDLAAPCLVFPLMEGGSLDARLRLTEADLASLYSMGRFTAPPKPLSWRQRLRAVLQATQALCHLHSLGCIHRDFKPANILLSADLHAMLADTGFAKSASESSAPAATKRASMTSLGAVHTTGYADPLITSSGEFSEKTDAYAVGITLLVVLTGRPAEGIIDACETDADDDFADIDPHALAESSIGWPAHVARALVPLVLSKEADVSLCTPKKRKRLELGPVVEQLTALLEAAAAAATGLASEGDGRSLLPDVTDATDRPDAAGAAEYVPSDATKLVRKLGRAAATSDAAGQSRRLQQKASEGFRHLMSRLSNVYASRASEAPDDFRERIDFWRASCGLAPPLHERLHRLRIWRNASEHGDDERWRREGPRDEAELIGLLTRCDELSPVHAGS